MFTKRWIQAVPVTLTLATAMGLVGNSAIAEVAKRSTIPQEAPPGSTAVRWETPARMHRAYLLSKDSGVLSIDEKGVEFRSGNGSTRSWKFLDIDTFSIAPHRLVLQTYSNRSLHRPGEQGYRFDLTQAVPPAVAASLAKLVGRPSCNTLPDMESPEIASFPVRHRRPTGGTNGILRFRKEGIDYVTTSSGDSRSWRWADLQTLSDPEPYRLFVFGYRDTYMFDLKEPLSRALFNRAADDIYAHTETKPLNSQVIPAPRQPEDRGRREENE